MTDDEILAAHNNENKCVEASLSCPAMCVRQAVKMVEAIVMIATLQQELTDAYAANRNASKIESVIKQLQELKKQIC